MKTCTLCGKTKPQSEFYKHSQKKDGLSPWCKLCARAKNKAYNDTHKKEKAEYDKKYRMQNIERLKAKQIEYTSTHKVEKAQYDKKYRERQGEARRADKRAYYHDRGGKQTAQKWYKANYELAKAHAKTSEYKRRSLTAGKISAAELVQWKRNQPHFCVYCGKTGADFTIDHIEPLSKGGKHATENLVYACRSCNSSKQNKQLIHWLATRQTDRSRR